MTTKITLNFLRKYLPPRQLEMAELVSMHHIRGLDKMSTTFIAEKLKTTTSKACATLCVLRDKGIVKSTKEMGDTEMHWSLKGTVGITKKKTKKPKFEDRSELIKYHLKELTRLINESAGDLSRLDKLFAGRT